MTVHISLFKSHSFENFEYSSQKLQIGIKLQYLVVVGAGKSYDHLIKLKSEYGGSLRRPGRSTCISFSCTEYFRKL
jgi:hypothetical protein